MLCFVFSLNVSLPLEVILQLPFKKCAANRRAAAGATDDLWHSSVLKIPYKRRKNIFGDFTNDEDKTIFQIIKTFCH